MRKLTRRQVALASAATVAALPGLAPTPSWLAGAQTTRSTIELRAPLGPPGTYIYLPFQVPPGTRRIDGRVLANGGAQTGLGLFDQRGPAYQSPGFRGVFGGELAQFSVAADRASRSFLPGTIGPGTWTAFVPVFQPGPDPTAEVVVEITLTAGEQPAALRPDPPPGVVRSEPGWYRGDLHCHTPESSDAWNSGTAMTSAEWAVECTRVGLDFAAMTDHNVVSQNLRLARDMAAAGGQVLLIGGEEMTNWFHGHATVTGLDPGEWLDWRQRPLGIPVQDHEARITEFVATCRELGAFSSAAHPFGPSVGLPWQFLLDGQVDPAAVPDGFEVWTGDFQPDDTLALQAWDAMLLRGLRVTANGGSDLHGTVNALQPTVAGGPTTVVWADALSTPAVVAGLQAGRCFITRTPDGGEVYLTATGPADQRTFTGGQIVGAPTDVVEVEALVRRGPQLADSRLLRLVLVRDGIPILTQPITAEEQVVGLRLPVGLGGYVRAELRADVELVPDAPTASRQDVEVVTNPIWLALDGEPVQEDAPPSARTDRRLRNHQRTAGEGT
jgi:hypothetical protein